MQKLKYWQSKDQLEKPEEFAANQHVEFEHNLADELSNESLESTTASRRDFLKLMGFSLGAATLAASCEIPVKKAIPWAIKPEEIVPGIANYYASCYAEAGEFCSILVKTREGRPIKIEGNKASSVNKGKSSARVQASILSLYDNNRVQNPTIAGKASDWTTVDKEITGTLNSGSNVLLISNTVMSPTFTTAIEDWQKKFPNTKHVMYDANSCSGLLDACQKAFGKRALPSFRFGKADVVVSFNADFLGTWISPVEFAADYASKRRPSLDNMQMSRHYQVESGLSLTGSNADERLVIKPSEEGKYVKELYNAVNGGSSSNTTIQKIAADLLANKGKSLVVSGSNDTDVQSVILAINSVLGNIGTTVDTGLWSFQRQGNDTETKNAIAEANSGKYDAIMVYNCNPVYDLPYGENVASALQKAKVSVSFNSHADETSTLCKYHTPDNHYLESWGDANPKDGLYYTQQPTIQPLFNTRQALSSLLVWMAHPILDKAKADKAAIDSIKPTSATLNRKSSDVAYEYIKSTWLRYTTEAEFENALRTGASEGAPMQPGGGAYSSAALSEALGKIGNTNAAGTELFVYEKVSIGDGRFQNNPWLQEMPDPTTRAAWDNYATINVHEAEEKKLKLGDVIEINANGKSFKLPVYPQYGQAKGTIGVALGFGRTKGVMKGYGDAGVSVYPCIKNGMHYAEASYKATGEHHDLACVQDHHTLHIEHDAKKPKKTGFAYLNSEDAADLADKAALKERTIIREFNLAEYKESSEKLKEKVAEINDYNKKGTIYKPYDYSQGNHWGMAIDLSACTGCGACTVACMSENNVPVVGKKEVLRKHEMTWIRIDRYFYGDPENPKTVYQPMMCQHCNNAPCENVCPVNATNHSAEGLNQMAYNRCIGTRYCANNCPYKVRRFNWLDYTTADVWGKGNDASIANMAENLTRMVLNPDVTVRSRGVIEKCSFCVQRLQLGKLEAKKQGRKLKDGDIDVACASVCPTGAITFGNLNDKEAAVTKAVQSERSYRVLEDFYTESNVTYLAKVHNAKEKLS